MTQKSPQVRQAAWNCGQLLGLARRWPVCFPYQPYCIFHAGTVLWCIASFVNGTPSHVGTTAETAPDRRTIALDKVPRIEFFESNNLTALYAAQLMQRQRDLADFWNPTEGSGLVQAALEEVDDISTEEGGRKILEITASLLANPAAPAISHRLEAVVRSLVP